MARSKVSFSSRQSYQKGYSLGNRGTAAPAGGVSPSVKGETLPTVSSGRTGGRRKSLASGGDGDLNISYSDTLPITDVKTVADYAKSGKAGKAVGVGKATAYPKPKSDSGSGFNYGKRR